VNGISVTSAWYEMLRNNCLLTASWCDHN